jgi:hypothetical protein
VNTLQSQWNKVGASGIVRRGFNDAFANPLNQIFDTAQGQNIVQYKSNSASAISTFNQITDSKRLSSFSSALSESSIPSIEGDTLEDGNGKLDNLRNSLNSSLLSIDSKFTAAPLSTDIPKSNVYNANGINYVQGSDGLYHPSQ